MPMMTVNDVELYYEEHGDGTPIVFCHEFAQDASGWAAQVSHFARSFRTVTYSRRGYLPSTIPTEPAAYAFPANVADLKALVERLGLGPAHFVGHGAGGNVALGFAIECPQAVRSLTLAGAGAGSHDAEDWKRVAEGMADRIAAAGPEGLADLMGSAPQRLAFRDKDPRGWAAFLDMLRGFSTEGAANAMRASGSRPTYVAMAEKIAQLDIPILLMLGDQDTPAFKGSSFIAATAPRAATAMMPVCGHTENLEEPWLFNYLLSGFFDRVDGGRWP